MSTKFSSFDRSQFCKAFTRSLTLARNRQSPGATGSVVAVSIAPGSGNPGSMYSNNAFAWNSPSSASAATGVAFSISLGTAGRFCAVGGSGGIQTSDDGGVTWTTRTSSISISFSDVCWCAGLGLFVAVASSNNATTNAIYSADGITWTNCTGMASITLRGVFTDGASTIVSVGDNGIIRTSTNGTAFSNHNISSSFYLKGGGYGGGQFVMVGNSTTLTPGAALWTGNGTSWTRQTVPSNSTLANLSSCAFSSPLNLWVAVTDQRTDLITSPDGITWTLDATLTGTWSCIRWSPSLGIFIAVDANTGDTFQVMTSPDGTSWTGRTAAKVSLWSCVASS